MAERTDRINVWVGLEHMFYATPEAYQRIIDMSRHYQIGFHTHSNESKFDVEETLRRYNMRPVEALEILWLAGCAAGAACALRLAFGS